MKALTSKRLSAARTSWRKAWIPVLLTGALALSGCRGSRSEPTTVESAGLEIQASVEPADPRVGENAMWLELRDARGRPVENADVDVKVHMHAMGTMPAMGGMARVTEVGEGAYRADFQLAMGSTWLVEVRATPPSGAAARAEGSLTVGTPGLRLEGVGPSAARGEERASPDVSPGEDGLDEGHPAEFSMDHSRLQRIGVRTAPVQSVDAETAIRAVGRIVYDETGLEDVSLKVRGWVGKLGVDAVGDPVERGEVLFTIYSPELYSAQEEYLQALRSQARARETGAPERADYLVRSARNRLRLWDIAPAELEQIERGGQPIEYLPIRARKRGYVIEKNVVAGSAVAPGERLYRIAPLDRVWIEADVYESELPLVSKGQRVSVTLPYLPGRSYEGTVAYVYPALAGKTRTGRVRIELPNPDLELRPDMYANVRLHAERGMRLVVPQSAVLYAGDRSFVFLELGEGRFRPQEVEVGIRSGEQVEILSGLEPGDRIVTSGTFLIASESRLRAALEKW